MNVQNLKALVKKTIELHEQDIILFGEELLKHPELGYKEVFSSDYVRKQYERLGIEMFGPLALTGVKGTLHGRSNGPNVCLLSELDAVVSPENPNAVSSGCAHACGHSTQTTQVYGAALALAEIMDNLDGNVTFFAVPAEEFLDLNYRLQLKEEGKISRLSGKQELISHHAFDDIDMVIMIHSQPNAPEFSVFVDGGSLGFSAKEIRFIGKEAHGASPFAGVNALQAAHLALAGINANRETFSEQEKMRIHPIITKGGDVVNTVPADVRMETYVRGSDASAIQKGCEVVDRCVHAAAEMMGAQYSIKNIQGYLPLLQDRKLGDVFASQAEEILGPGSVVRGVDMIGSTDIGDLSHLLPCIQPTMGGFIGDAHSKEFRMVDPRRSYITGAEILADTVVELLADGGKLARQIITGFTPAMSREAYMEHLDT